MAFQFIEMRMRKTNICKSTTRKTVFLSTEWKTKLKKRDVLKILLFTEDYHIMNLAALRWTKFLYHKCKVERIVTNI